MPNQDGTGPNGAGRRGQERGRGRGRGPCGRGRGRAARGAGRHTPASDAAGVARFGQDRVEPDAIDRLGAQVARLSTRLEELEVGLAEARR